MVPSNVYSGFTIAGGTYFVTVDVTLMDSYGHKCHYTMADSNECPQADSTHCFDDTSRIVVLNVVSDTLSDSCHFQLDSWPHASVGYTWVGQQWYDGSTPISSYIWANVSTSGGTTKLITVVWYAVDSLGDTCVSSSHIYLNCDGTGHGTYHSKPGRNTSTNTSVGSTIKVLPNPNNGMFTLNITNDGIRNVEVYDMMGQKVFENVYNSPQQVAIDLRKLNTGNYLVRVNSSLSARIIKQ